MIMIAVRMMCLNSHSLEQLSSVWPLPTADDELRWILVHSYFLHLRLSGVINNISCSNEVSVEVSACWLFSKCHSALFAAKQCNKAWNKKWWKRFHSPRLPAKEKVISGALFGLKKHAGCPARSPAQQNKRIIVDYGIFLSSSECWWIAKQPADYH